MSWGEAQGPGYRPAGEETAGKRAVTPVPQERRGCKSGKPRATHAWYWGVGGDACTRAKCCRLSSLAETLPLTPPQVVSGTFYIKRDNAFCKEPFGSDGHFLSLPFFSPPPTLNQHLFLESIRLRSKITSLHFRL